MDGYAVRCCHHIDLRMRSDCCHVDILRNYLKNIDLCVFCALSAFLSKGGWGCRLDELFELLKVDGCAVTLIYIRY